MKKNLQAWWSVLSGEGMGGTCDSEREGSEDGDGTMMYSLEMLL